MGSNTVHLGIDHQGKNSYPDLRRTWMEEGSFFRVVLVEFLVEFLVWFLNSGGVGPDTIEGRCRYEIK
jgi:hypothetical protein